MWPLSDKCLDGFPSRNRPKNGTNKLGLSQLSNDAYLLRNMEDNIKILRNRVPNFDIDTVINK